MANLCILVILLLQSFVAADADSRGPRYIVPSEELKWSRLTEEERSQRNQDIFSKYCLGRADSADVPFVNYDNKLVSTAAERLSAMEYNAFYFYAGPARAYGLKTKAFDVYRDLQKNAFVWVEVGATPPPDVAEKIQANKYQVMTTDKKKRVWYDPRNKSKPKDVSDPAHALLVQLCGEFRDRATLIEEKINWFNRLWDLPVEEMKFNPKKELWEQFSAADYWPFLDLTGRTWQAKRQFQQLVESKSVEPLPTTIEGQEMGILVELLNAGRFVAVGSESHDVAVPGMTICETRYLFGEYLKKSLNPWGGEIKSDMPKYIQGLAHFQKKNCTESDLAFFYDFRGDSNIKHYSPESNGMIWHAASVSANCSSTSVARTDQTAQINLRDSDCIDYFRSPFRSRWNAARAGLGAWLSYAETHESRFRNASGMVAVFPFERGGDPEGEASEPPRYLDASTEPYSFAFDVNATGGGPASLNLSEAWLKIHRAFDLPSLGLTEMADYGSQEGQFFVFNRLRNAVNRHTNWYQSGFNDGRGLVRPQAYSPFLASSYEPKESNAFTAPGYTVQGDKDGRKYLMYVFRVPVANWVHSLTIKNGQTIDFDRAWLDETSLGDAALADREKAFDRLGTAIEGELDSILYLHNIEHETNRVSDSPAPIVYQKD